jgi:hypothetical protein
MAPWKARPQEIFILKQNNQLFGIHHIGALVFNDTGIDFACQVISFIMKNVLGNEAPRSRATGYLNS